MKLLFDHHLSRKLVARLTDQFPGSSHVAFHGLDDEEDTVIWEFARDQGYTIVSKDSDFTDISTLRGTPPKLIWLRVGNCTTTTIELILRSQYVTIVSFITHSPDRILEIV